jgi:hypothetical protein
MESENFNEWWVGKYLEGAGHGLFQGTYNIPVKNFLFSTSSRLAVGSTQPPIQWLPGALSPRLKLPERGADHSPPTSAEVKKMCIYTSTPPYAFMA